MTGVRRRCLLTHWLQLGDELVLGPLLLVAPERQARGDDGQLVVVRVWHVQVVDEDDVGVLQEPVAATVECRKYRRVDVATVDALAGEGSH